MRLRSLMNRLAASTVLIAAAIGAQAAPSISGRELSVGASDVQQYLDGSFPRTQDALGGLIALTMSHPQLSLPAGERLNLGMDVALATAGGNPAKLGTVKLSSGLRYDAQTQGFHLQQPSVDDFTPANQGGRLDSRTRGLLNAWLSDYAQREPIYKLDPAVAGVLGALQVQSAQVKNGKLVVTFNQNLGNLVPAGVLGKEGSAGPCPAASDSPAHRDRRAWPGATAISAWAAAWCRCTWASRSGTPRSSSAWPYGARPG